MAALLRQVGRRKIDRHLLKRHRQTDCRKRGPHPLAAFAHGLVGQPHDVEIVAGDGVAADMDLNIHLARLNTLERDRVNMSNRHAPPPTLRGLGRASPGAATGPCRGLSQTAGLATVADLKPWAERQTRWWCACRKR